MAIRKLDRTEWRIFCDRASRGFIGKRAEIEVLSVDLGHQIPAHWLVLEGIVYDDTNDILEILVEGLAHLVRSPRELYIDDDVAGMISLEVIDRDGARQIVLLRDPLMLPAPALIG